MSTMTGTSSKPKQWHFETTISFNSSTPTSASSSSLSPSNASFANDAGLSRQSPSLGTNSQSKHTASPSNSVGFSFVNVIHPNDAKHLNSKRAIRSHVAKVQHSRTRAAGTRVKKSKATNPARALQPRQIDIKVEPASGVDGELLDEADAHSLRESPITTGEDSPIKGTFPSPEWAKVPSIASDSSFQFGQEDVDESVEEIPRYNIVTRQDRHDSHASDTSEDDYAYVADAADTLQMSTPQQADRFLHRILTDGTSTSRRDPFWSYPVDRYPSLDPIIDHYLVHILVDTEFLASPEQPDTMKRGWFPLSMTEPAIFWAVALVASAHFRFVNAQRKQSINLFTLKQKAIEHVNEALADPKRSISDATLGAVMKLACYEAMWGDTAAYDAHMSGLQQLVRHRGGLGNLGLNGLLERTVLWIDSNGSSSIGCGWKFADKRWWPTIYEHPTPDPLRFSRMADDNSQQA